ncbi:MAG: alpha-galactosidase [Clostridia bacterium]|nr:alpha-galactosidase [Clostridia bacterium]
MAELYRNPPFTVRVKAAEIPSYRWKKTGDNVYTCDAPRLTVTVSMETYPKTGACRQINTIRNDGDEEVFLTGFSSALINTCHGDIGIVQNRWMSEGQWKRFSMEQLGVIPTSIHPWERGTYRIASVGSWATGDYSGHYPITMVYGDDGFVYYMEVEGAHNWMLEHSCSGGFSAPYYFLEGTAAHEENGGWYYRLAPGESYSAQPAVWGSVKGGIEEAAKEILTYKRATSKANFKDGIIPVVFNDYMNCLWGVPSDKKLLPLIDAAAEVGCEYFCIDAGWHKNANPGGTSGDWIIDESRFGEIGLAGVFAHMKEKGLIPGVWFELDTVNESAASYHLDDDCLLKRYGSVIPRAFFNFKNDKVRAHLAARIDDLYNMGVRYIKNDYNQTTGIGCDNDGGSPAQGLIENYEAFCSFIDEVRAAHPDLIIENCGSGGCREEHGTLQHFHLQSTSDQEYYYLNPSIITGVMRGLMAPEKAGIWSYPMPVLFDDRDSCPFDDAWQKQFADGEETIFNMVNGMCGVLYQSGRLDHADAKNLALVKEGITAYKTMRAMIPAAHPILPMGSKALFETGTLAAGLEADDGTHAYLAVWRIGTDEEKVTVDLGKYGYSKAEIFYPAGDTLVSFENGILSVTLPKRNSTRMILLKK